MWRSEEGIPGESPEVVQRPWGGGAAWYGRGTGGDQGSWSRVELVGPRKRKITEGMRASTCPGGHFQHASFHCE